MKIIAARHIGGNKVYLFKCPGNWPITYIQNGDLLFVDTINGRTPAIAASGIMEGERADEFATLFGAYLPLKPVTGAVKRENVITLISIPGWEKDYLDLDKKLPF